MLRPCLKPFGVYSFCAAGCVLLNGVSWEVPHFLVLSHCSSSYAHYASSFPRNQRSPFLLAPYEASTPTDKVLSAWNALNFLLPTHIMESPRPSGLCLNIVPSASSSLTYASSFITYFLFDILKFYIYEIFYIYYMTILLRFAHLSSMTAGAMPIFLLLYLQFLAESLAWSWCSRKTF